MARTARWTETREDGVLTFALSDWKYFDALVNQRLMEFSNYIWRGQASAEWKLESTLDRALRKAKKYYSPDVRDEHLEAFKKAARGRRGANPPAIKSEDEWWALGQHFGLATPLLDWTRSPFVAAYFAFVNEQCEGATRRAVFAFQHILVADECAKRAKATGGKYERECRLVIPMSDENSRLVSQGGLFTRAPDGVDLETWVREHFKGFPKGILIKITIPNRCRSQCLRALNRMNINHLSLFPDLYGSSKHCNQGLSIDGYSV